MNEKRKTNILSLKNGLIVSCQAVESDPHYSEDFTLQMAKAASWGGAQGLRLDTPYDISKIKKQVNLPVIGLWKVFSYDSEVFITPTIKEVDACIQAGADIIAVDGTNRQIQSQPAFRRIAQIVTSYPDTPILADVRNLEDALLALEAGADFVAPTLCRFDPNKQIGRQPDFELLCSLVKACGKEHVIMESKINTPEDAVASLYYGAYAVVVGNAITRPNIITQHFVDAIQGFPEKRSLLYWQEHK